MSSSSYYPPSPAHPPSRVTPVITLPANPSTRNKWRSNQCVTIGCKSANQLVVTSRQSRSTPGIYTEVYLKQNSSYRIAVTGQALRHAKAFVFVYDPSTKCRLIPNYTMLSNSLCTVSAEFCTPHCANDYVRLWLGVLFTGPPCNGQQFCLKTIAVTTCGPSHSKQHPSSSHGPTHGPTHDKSHPNSGPPTYSPCYPKPAPGCPPPHQPCPPQYQCPPQCPPDCPPQCPPQCPPGCPPECSSDSSSDDDDCETHYHHHRVIQTNRKDPYYTYDTSPPSAAYAGSYGQKDTYHQQPPSSCKAPAYSSTGASSAYPAPAAPSCPAPASQPVSISDLQTSLGSMISQMKGGC